VSILDGAPTHPARRPRRRGRGLAALLVVLLILAGLAVVADRVIVGQVEQGVTDSIETSIDARAVTTDIEGFPFLTQILGGEIRRIDLTAASAVLEDVPFSDVDAVITELPFDLATRALGAAGTVTASGTLATADLQTLLERELTDLPDVTLATRDGSVVASTGLVGGLTLDVTLLPRAADGQIAVDVGTLTVAGFDVPITDLPAGLAARLTDLRIEVPGLPDGLAISQLDVIDAGVRVTVAGTGVDLTAVG